MSLLLLLRPSKTVDGRQPGGWVPSTDEVKRRRKRRKQEEELAQFLKQELGLEEKAEEVAEEIVEISKGEEITSLALQDLLTPFDVSLLVKLEIIELKLIQIGILLVRDKQFEEDLMLLMLLDD